MVTEMDQSGILSTLSWIFNWSVPKVKHPRPMDVAMNNYASYIRRGHLNKKSPLRRDQTHNSSQKWSRRKRKNKHSRKEFIGGASDPYLSNTGLLSHPSQTNPQRFQHRISSSNSPYQFEKPLPYYDSSQVYFYPSHKN